MEKRKFLVTGIGSGLGEYLFWRMPDVMGLSRSKTSWERIQNVSEFDTIIHCAFNKQKITYHEDLDKYIEDNLLLTSKLLKLKYNKFIYISTVDVYDQNNLYASFKKCNESILSENPHSLILRCSMMLGVTMKPNHVTKLKSNIDLSLNENSMFNYILMEDILKFITSGDYNSYSGKLDFVANEDLKLKDLKEHLGSNSELGNYVHNSQFDLFRSPIFKFDKKYNKSSLDNIKQYFK